MSTQSISSNPAVRCGPIPLAVLVWFAAVAHGLADPTIVVPPKHQTNAIGSTATLCVVATGTEPLTYQWHTVRSGPIYTELPGATNACLELPDIQPWINTNAYRVAVCNPVGCVTSTVSARVYVIVPPFISQQPNNQTLEIGENYTNRVTVTNLIGALGYQWFFNEDPLPGQTLSNLTILNVQSTNAGDYHVVVTNLAGSVTSDVARLTVVGPGSTFTKITTGPIPTDLGYSVGAAWADYDGDGWVDLFVANNFWEATSAPNFLYHNLGQGVFERVTNEPFASDSGKYASAVWWDYDNDGRLDLLVGGYAGTPAGAVLHYRNEGNGGFSRVHDPVLEGSNGLLPAAGDYDNDGAVDLICSRARTNFLFRNNGNGSFVQITTGPIATDRLRVVQNKAWGDYDNDGDLDLVVGVSPDIQPALYTNQGNGTFARVTQGAIPTNTTSSVTPSWGDCNNDGFLDLFFSSVDRAAPSSLFYNSGHGDFTKVAFVTGGSHTDGAWADYDNDGWLDLFIPNTEGTCLLYRNNGDGTFTSIRSLVVTKQSATHEVAAWADYDNDGFLDLFVTDAGSQPNFLYHNDGNSNHWLMLKLEGTVANRAAIGAKVRVRATIGGRQFWQLRVISADSFAQNDLRAHFGLGDATRAEIVRVEWPSTNVTEWHNVAAGQILTLTEPVTGGPQIIVQPTDQTNLIGTTATFSVSTAGAPPLTYQWRSYSTTTTFTNIPDATNDTLVLPDVQTAPYRFAVEVCNPSGCVTSDLVRLVIHSPPRITNEPPDQTVCLSDNYTNYPGTTGTTPLRYQWYFNGESLPGKVARILTLTDVQFTNAGDYFVTVTNLYGAVTSRTARLTVVCCSLTITTEPVDRRLAEGETYDNQVAATGTRPITYQWYFNGEPLARETNSSLSIPNVQGTNEGNYTVIVTNLCDAVTSRVARLTLVLPGTTFTKITEGDIVNDASDAGGCTWGDYDNDGYIDLFVGSGYHGVVTKNKLYHNNRDRTFTRMPASQVGSLVEEDGYWSGCAWGDYDNDGWFDIVVGANNAYSRKNGLFRNNGNGSFTKVTTAVSDVGGISVCWADYDRDGWIDVLATPGSYGSPRNFLFRNLGDGAFTSVTADPLTAASGYRWAAAWADMDDDGNPDVVVTEHGGSHTVFLYKNKGEGQFDQVTNTGMTSFPGTGPICPSWGDYDNDGLPDLFVAGWNVASHLYHNEGASQFRDIPFGFPPSYVNKETFLGMWADYDNDGDLDLFVDGGSSIAGCTNLGFQNNGDGTFTRILSGSLFDDFGLSTACAWGDYDNDGFPDLFVAGASGQGSRLYRNNGNGNAWLMLKLEGRVSNGAAIGAKVRVLASLFGRRYWQMREISGGNMSQNDLRAHFGLGNATQAERVRIEWPSGQVTELSNVAANQILSIKEPPLLKAAGWSPEGGFQMKVIAHANSVCDVMTSSTVADPASWTMLQCVTNTSRTNLVVDPAPPSGPGARFYKAVPR